MDEAHGLPPAPVYSEHKALSILPIQVNPAVNCTASQSQDGLDSCNWRCSATTDSPESRKKVVGWTVRITENFEQSFTGRPL